ncbi:hypothetical protein Bca4012_018466 [Brassica carinata]|uniref:Uncharacterized protein n=1 Tax=Brassica carinata TaxID=52824 RepID=A0A8X7WJB9_BRACI|nr:hypothetical protein Bca52824_003129 [Brassica carinata]
MYSRKGWIWLQHSRGSNGELIKEEGYVKENSKLKIRDTRSVISHNGCNEYGQQHIHDGTDSYGSDEMGNEDIGEREWGWGKRNTPVGDLSLYLIRKRGVDSSGVASDLSYNAQVGALLVT